MNKAEKTGIALAIVLVILIWLTVSLCPLWVWLDNGKTIYGGINNTALSFGLAFIGTGIANGFIGVGISVGK